MEIVKQNEVFNLSDTTEVFEMQGNANYDVSGSLQVHFTVNKIGGEYIGDAHYNKYSESPTVNFGINCSEENRKELTSYVYTLIDTVLKHFNSSN